MARAHNIYIVVSVFGNVKRAFTVLHEARTWLLGLDSWDHMQVLVIRDGRRGTKTYTYDIKTFIEDYK